MILNIMHILLIKPYKLCKASLTRWDLPKIEELIDSFCRKIHEECDSLYLFEDNGEQRVLERCHFDRCDTELIPTTYWYKVKKNDKLTGRKKDTASIEFVNQYNLYKTENLQNIDNYSLIPNSRIAIGMEATVYDYFCKRNILAIDKIIGVLRSYQNGYGYEVLELLVSSAINLIKLSDKKASSQMPYWLPKKDVTSRNAVMIIEKKADIFKRGLKYLNEKCKYFVGENDNIILENMPAQNISIEFPNVELIENSRINFTAPQYTVYKNLFSKRQQIALVTLKHAIAGLPETTRAFFEDTLISIVHYGKYTDYRSKSQDNHCPDNRLKETNLYHRFLEKLNERRSYIERQKFDLNLLEINCMDYRKFLHTILPNTVDLLLTDPPYGDNAQYFEHAQRVHPFMEYSLKDDSERLHKEVVISNAPSRKDKHGKEQFLKDIEQLFKEAYRVIDDHGFMVLYFRPQQKDWVSDLNKLKDFGRRHGFEPLLTISAGISDPSMRALASAAWTFKNDVCFIFLKLQENERRWYEDEIDIDELVFLAATKAATDQGNPFVITQFNQEFLAQLRRCGLMRLAHPMYESKIKRTLDRFTTRIGAQYRLTGLSPYTLMNREMNAEIRLREFAPIVIEELTANGQGFTFEDYVIHLSSFMENGSREIINQLHTAKAFYICQTKNKGGDCTRHSIPEEVLKKIVLKEIQMYTALFVDYEMIMEELQQMEVSYDQVISYDTQITKLQEEYNKCYSIKVSLADDLKSGMITKEEFDEFRESYSKKCEELDQMIEHQKKLVKQMFECGVSAKVQLEDWKKSLEIKELDRTLLALTVDKIYIYENKQIKIRIRYQDVIEKMKVIKRFYTEHQDEYRKEVG